MGKRNFGELEHGVLNILKSGKRMTVKEVQALLGGDDKYTTIMTVLLRLAKKKVLARERMGLQYEYWLVAPLSFVDQIKKKIFGVKPMELISYFIEAPHEISDDELLEMEKMVEIAKQKRKK